jgi:thiol-disulfide isomerase/thioredoxin
MILDFATTEGRAIFAFIFMAVLIVILGIAGKTYLKIVQWRTRHRRWPEEVWNGKTTLLEFGTEECVVCKFQQSKEVDAIRENFSENELDVHKFNATEQTDIASLLGVVNVPTTVIIDSKGNVKAFNSGLTKEKRLTEQIQAALG